MHSNTLFIGENEYGPIRVSSAETPLSCSEPTISLLEAVVTKDPRWHWLEAAWDASDDESVRELAGFVREHRVTLANELAGHVRTVCAPAGGDEPVIVDPE